MSILFSNPKSPQTRVANPPIVAQMDPPVSGPRALQYPIGTMWINTVSNVVFMLTSFSNGEAFWQETIAGAPGVFSDLSVDPGPTSIVGEFRVLGNIDEAEVIRLREDGGSSGSIEIASLQGTGSDSIKIQSVSGGMQITTNAAAGDIAITSTLGSIPISSGENNPGAIELLVDGGANSTLILTNTNGTGADAIDINVPLGGIDIDVNAIALDTVNDLDITVGGDLTIAVDGNATNTLAISNVTGTVPANAGGSVAITSSLGGIFVSADQDFIIGGVDSSAIAVTGVNKDLVMGTTNGAVQLNADGANGVLSLNANKASVDAVEINSVAGGIDVNLVTDMTIDSSTGKFHVNTASATSDAVAITAGSGGGIQINAAQDIALNASNAINLSAIADSSFVTTGAGNDINIQSTSAKVALNAGSGTADAIVLDAFGVSGGISIAPTNTTASVQIANVIPTVARTVTVSGGAVGSAVADTLNLGSGATSFAGASKVVNIGTGDNTLGITAVNIATGNKASGSSLVNISTGTGTKSVSVGNADGLTTASINGTVNINTSTTATATTIGSAIGGAVTAQSNTATANAIRLNASNAAGGITATVGSNNFNVSGGNIVMPTAGTGLTLTPAPATPASLLAGAGDPNGSVTAGQGSIYMNVTGSGVANRLWVNSDGATTWVAVTTVS
ncbi:beta strand repeat-containing protein [Methylobacter sp.]|uniref:beta strand repeat-containing protein n=1 Tax=Methylobacter sp. TaxID=2051955 RepID=UPI003DA582AA